MKRSEELLGLSIISINDGKEVGKVKDLIINPEEGKVECLVVDDGTRYLGVKVLPSKYIEGVGEYAVTVESTTTITSLEELSNLEELLDKNVQVKGTKVLTKKGRLIGSVNEFYVDEEEEGKIVACELVTPKGDKVQIIPAEGVVTYGKDVLVVVEEIDGLLRDSVAGENMDVVDNATVPRKDSELAQDDEKSQIDDVKEEAEEVSEAAKVFEERQRQFLIGRKVSKKIETDLGEVLAEEGTVITEELLEKVKQAGKFTELSMNNRS